MIGHWILLALFAAGVDTGQDLFQLRFQSGGIVLTLDAPVEKAGRLVFRRHPDGMLISVKASEVVGIVPVHRGKPRSSLRPGEQLDIGLTGAGPELKGGPSQPGVRPEEGSAGSRAVTPNREYRSMSGRRLVVGYNVPFAPAPAAQRAPGEPPTGVQSGPPPTRPD